MDVPSQVCASHQPATVSPLPHRTLGTAAVAQRAPSFRPSTANPSGMAACTHHTGMP